MTSLDKDEQNILNSVENNEWQSIENLREEIKQYQAYANSQSSSNKIEVILLAEEMNKMQELAQHTAESVSNLTRNIVQKYLKGELIERSS